MKPEDRNPEAANRAHWDEVAPVHLNSYGIEGLLAGKSRIDEIQKRELYPVAGKDLLHLQCHIGTDTLSLALDGARVTGVDFSPKSIEIARSLARRMGIGAEFIVANVLDLQDVLRRQFDIVYTSKGVLCWIRDIRRWAETVSFLLKPGGTFYVMDIHPFAMIFDDDERDGLAIRYPYFAQAEPLLFDDDHPDYSDFSYIPKRKTFEWAWPLSDIVNALIGSGLTVEFLHEFDRAFFKAHSGMREVGGGWWEFERYRKNIPFTFSLKAGKPGK
jgi:SAM-dependent methyltransferase